MALVFFELALDTRQAYNLARERNVLVLLLDVILHRFPKHWIAQGERQMLCSQDGSKDSNPATS